MSRHISLAVMAALLGYGFWVSPEFKEIAAGVAIFLFGMMALEEGFKSFTGGTLERILQHSTDRMWKSLLFGFSTTTLMQSSSLVSIISISFLSAGLLGLAQGIGIIFGANLGSTTGAWLVAGFGLKVDIAAYAMPMLAFGVLLIFAKSRALKGTGYVLAGLGFLFLGIHYMKEGFEAFGQSIDLAAFARPGIAGLLLFTVIGMIATVLMQSSHATLVLIITALAAQQITYENALALSIGANVGTTVTAIIGSLGANVAGRRLAGAHFVFNVSTGLVALLFINQFMLAVEAGSRLLGIAANDHTLKLALFHSLFNLTGVLLMLPLTGRLVTFLETWMKPESRSVSSPRFINKSMLEMPDAGLEAARKELRHMFSNVFDVMALALHTDPARLRRGESLESLDRPPERVREIDIDDYYQRRIKPLYGDILDFLAWLKTEGPQSRQAFMLRSAGQHMVEALKDLKHMQKNMLRCLASTSPHPRNEYVALRRALALLLHELHRIADHPDESHSLELDNLRAQVEAADIVTNGTLDRLIRERLVTRENASSLMNDNAYMKDISGNLLTMADLLLMPFEPIKHEIEQELHLDQQEIEAVLASTRRPDHTTTGAGNELR